MMFISSSSAKATVVSGLATIIILMVGATTTTVVKGFTATITITATATRRLSHRPDASSMIWLPQPTMRLDRKWCSFQPCSSYRACPLVETPLRISSRCYHRRKDNYDDSAYKQEDEEEEDEEIDLSDQDWRSFRAKLVMSENHPTILSSSSLSPSATEPTNTNIPTSAPTTKTTTATSSADAASTTIAAAEPSSGATNNNDLDGIGAIFSDIIDSTMTLPPTAKVTPPPPSIDDASSVLSSTGSSSSTSHVAAVETSSTSTSTSATTDPTTTAAAAAAATPTTAASSWSQLMQNMTPLHPSQWAYDSGKVIEQGAVILGGVEQDYGFGLRQQYFHKAAILVLDHEENTFTKGIILNRPTDLMLQDDVNPGLTWRVWFGGDVQGLNSPVPDIVCLHSLKHTRANDASIPVMKDIQWTTFENAKRLVQMGIAQPADFWLFSGYAGWGPGQLMSELDRKSWYMVATDSQTLLQELARQAATADPRDAGLETWILLMHMIGRGSTATQYTAQDNFDDLMLKEWARQYLLSSPAGGGAGPQSRPAPVITSLSTLLNKFMSGKQPRPAAATSGSGSGSPPPQAHGQVPTGSSKTSKAMPITSHSLKTNIVVPAKIVPGTLVRASAADRSPFLLSDQELHKSLVFILKEDDEMTVGVILNRPSAKGLDIEITQQQTGRRRLVTLPMRFGGPYAVRAAPSPSTTTTSSSSSDKSHTTTNNGKNGGSTASSADNLLWLHCSSRLRALGIGAPVGPPQTSNGIWKCTPPDVVTAMRQNVATPTDFWVISGVSVWKKNPLVLGGSGGGGIREEMVQGKFEIVPTHHTQAIWDALSQQELLSDSNLHRIVAQANEAWKKAGVTTNAASNGGGGGGGWWIPGGTSKNGSEPQTNNNNGAAADNNNFPNNDPTVVFKSNVKVAALSDDALQSWVATFLLGTPTRGGTSSSRGSGGGGSSGETTTTGEAS